MKKGTKWLIFAITLAVMLCVALPIFAATNISSSGTAISVVDTQNSSVTHSLQCTASQTTQPITSGSQRDNGSTSVTHENNVFTLSAKNSTYRWVVISTQYAQNYTASLTITNPSDATLKIVYSASGLDDGNGTAKLGKPIEHNKTPSRSC